VRLAQVILDDPNMLAMFAYWALFSLPDLTSEHKIVLQKLVS